MATKLSILAVVMSAAHAGVASCGHSAPTMPTVGQPAALTAQANDAMSPCVQVDEAGNLVNDKLNEAALRQLLGQRVSLRGGISRTKPGDFMGCNGAEVQVHVDDPLKVPAIATGTLVLVWDAHYYRSVNEGKKPGEPMAQDYDSHWAISRFELKLD